MITQHINGRELFHRYGKPIFKGSISLYDDDGVSVCHDQDDPVKTSNGIWVLRRSAMKKLFYWT